MRFFCWRHSTFVFLSECIMYIYSYKRCARWCMIYTCIHIKIDCVYLYIHIRFVRCRGECHTAWIAHICMTQIHVCCRHSHNGLPIQCRRHSHDGLLIIYVYVYIYTHMCACVCFVVTYMSADFGMKFYLLYMYICIYIHTHVCVCFVFTYIHIFIEGLMAYIYIYSYQDCEISRRITYTYIHRRIAYDDLSYIHVFTSGLIVYLLIYSCQICEVSRRKSCDSTYNGVSYTYIHRRITHVVMRHIHIFKAGLRDIDAIRWHI